MAKQNLKHLRILQGAQFLSRVHASEQQRVFLSGECNDKTIK